MRTEQTNIIWCDEAGCPAHECVTCKANAERKDPMTTTLPDLIVFKDEDEISGEPVGPAIGYTQAELNDSTDGIGVPFNPDRLNRWVTRSQALALAREYGAEFRES